MHKTVILLVVLDGYNTWSPSLSHTHTHTH